jgi:hypothetical protein
MKNLSEEVIEVPIEAEEISEIKISEKEVDLEVIEVLEVEEALSVMIVIFKSLKSQRQSLK